MRLDVNMNEKKFQEHEINDCRFFVAYSCRKKNLAVD